MIRCFYSIACIILLVACADEVKKNKLASATSPYLRQHADNPVDWYEWGSEPLARAKKENKPLLISIGYASCHWCHQMEKESFMDTGVARIMNEYFVCVKVDREERPDVDNVYMYACKLLSGGDGGWPLNAFALPDGKPFFAGTYYSKNSWKSLLLQIAAAYKDKNTLVVRQAEELTRGIADASLSFSSSDSFSTPLSKIEYQKCFNTLYTALDTINGGFKGNVKFPMPAVSEFLLQFHYQTQSKKAIDIATVTLKKAALGGIYDQVGGGFARYATDPKWHVPHFEKMLYDNAQLISVYAHAYQMYRDEFYKRIVNESISFVERELASGNGAYYSSSNADTENGEGNFYSWTEKEFKDVIGDSEVAEYYNISSSGNWKTGKNLLSSLYEPHEFAKNKGISADQFISQLDNAKSRLLTERNKRARPQVDTKIITSWNAMLLKAYVDAFLAIGEERYLTKAVSIANFLEKNMLQKGGMMKRLFNGGTANVDGFLDDNAWSAYAFVKLYEASFDKHWLDLAKQITDVALKKFYNEQLGLFHYSSVNDSKLVVNNIETADEAIPSSNAVMATVLYLLGTIYDEGEYVELSHRNVAAVSDKVKKFPAYHAKWLSLAGLFTSGTHEVAVMGKNASAVNRTLQKSYLPDCIFMGQTDKENLPLLQNKLVMNKTLIYVCTNKVCKKPVEEVSQALAIIKAE